MDKNTTTVTCLTDDQGGGGMLCNTCHHFEYMGYWDDECPNCHRKLANHPLPEPYPFGGSDF